MRPECRDLLRKSPYSVRMPQNTDQKNSEYGHFLLSGLFADVPLSMFPEKFCKLTRKSPTTNPLFSNCNFTGNGISYMCFSMTFVKCSGTFWIVIFHSIFRRLFFIPLKILHQSKKFIARYKLKQKNYDSGVISNFAFV